MSRAMIFSLAVVLALSAGTMLWAQAAAAEESRGWYLTAGAGINHLDQEGSKDPVADIGFRVVLGGGYRFNPRWALEFDSGLIRTTFPDDPIYGPEPTLSEIPLVVNGLLHFPNDTGLEPFVGAGAGVTIGSTERDTGGDITFAFKGGVRRAVNDRIAVAVDYTFFMLMVSSAFVGEPVGNDTVNLTVQWRR